MTPTRRRGTAPLEFVLVLPLLFTIVIAGWWCARAGLTKLSAATEARRAAWDRRADADPGEPFDLQQSPLVSAVSEQVTHAVPGGNPFAAEAVHARSSALMVDKCWDHEQAEFPRLPDSPVSAHQKSLLQLGEFLPFVALRGPEVEGFAAMDLPANGRFSRRLPQAAADRARRRASTATFALGPVAIAAAIAQCFAMVAEFPPSAAYYAELIATLGLGMVPSAELVPVSRK